VLEQLGPIAKVETQARLEGRNMTMVLVPDKKMPPKKPENQNDTQDSARNGDAPVVEENK
jgi:hypothetical protein